MAPSRKHDTDRILDAVRALVLAEGPRATSVAAISRASGAPVGTLYHRFGDRDGIVAAAWLRALERFLAGALQAAEAPAENPVAAGGALAAAPIAFAASEPDDARLLLTVRREDLFDRADAAQKARLDELNRPLDAALAAIARALHGRTDRRARDAVARAVVDLPTGALRRHLRPDGRPLPPWLAADVAAAARRLLTPPAGDQATDQPLRERRRPGA